MMYFHHPCSPYASLAKLFKVLPKNRVGLRWFSCEWGLLSLVWTWSKRFLRAMPSSACLISIDATSFHFRHCNCFVELGVINQLRLNQNHHCALNFALLLWYISPQATSPTNDYLQGRQLNWIWGHQGLNCCDQTCTVIELEWLFELVNDNCGCLAETASEISEFQPSSDQKDWTKLSTANCTGKCRFWRDVAIWQNIML